jgi:MFS transporter, DHA1 family, inner membrane transport protein
LDEVASGVPPTDAPAIARDLASEPGRFAGILVAAFYAISVVVDPALYRWIEKVEVRWALGASLLAIAAVTIGASFSTSAALLVVFVALYGSPAGVAHTAAEGTLVESAPHMRERILARIALFGAVGDLVVPPLIALIGWRATFQVAAAIAIALAALVLFARALSRPLGQLEDEGEESSEPPPRLRDALRNRALLGWMSASSLGDLMDEVASAFVAVHIHSAFDGDPAVLAIALSAWTIGGIAGLALLDRLLARHAPMRLLAIACVIALAGFAVVIFARDVYVVCIALFVLGAAVDTFYPIVDARTYAALPGHPGVVNAVGTFFTPVDIAAPLALGALASAFGSWAALAALMAVPAILFVVALRSKS